MTERCTVFLLCMADSFSETEEVGSRSRLSPA